MKKLQNIIDHTIINKIKSALKSEIAYILKHFFLYKKLINWDRGSIYRTQKEVKISYVSN